MAEQEILYKWARSHISLRLWNHSDICWKKDVFLCQNWEKNSCLFWAVWPYERVAGQNVPKGGFMKLRGFHEAPGVPLVQRYQIKLKCSQQTSAWWGDFKSRPRNHRRWRRLDKARAWDQKAWECSGHWGELGTAVKVTVTCSISCSVLPFHLAYVCQFLHLFCFF